MCLPEPRCPRTILIFMLCLLINNRDLFDFNGALKEGFINGSTVLDKRDSAVTQNKTKSVY